MASASAHPFREATVWTNREPCGPLTPSGLQRSMFAELGKSTPRPPLATSSSCSDVSDEQAADGEPHSEVKWKTFYAPADTSKEGLESLLGTLGPPDSLVVFDEYHFSSEAAKNRGLWAVRRSTGGYIYQDLVKFVEIANDLVAEKTQVTESDGQSMIKFMPSDEDAKALFKTDVFLVVSTVRFAWKRRPGLSMDCVLLPGGANAIVFGFMYNDGDALEGLEIIPSASKVAHGLGSKDSKLASSVGVDCDMARGHVDEFPSTIFEWAEALEDVFFDSLDISSVTSDVLMADMADYLFRGDDFFSDDSDDSDDEFVKNLNDDGRRVIIVKSAKATLRTVIPPPPLPACPTSSKLPELHLVDIPIPRS